MVASPADFTGTPLATPAMAPELGQHTEEVLLELGYDWEQIGALRDAGARRATRRARIGGTEGRIDMCGDTQHATSGTNRVRRVAIGLLLLGLAAANGRGTATAAAPDSASSTLPLHAVHGAPADGLDERTPLPLTAMMADHQKRNMRDHLAAVQEIVTALGADDMAAAEAAARRIGYSDSMAQMCQHMGAGASGFTERALAFHRSADTIADAARRGDRRAVTTALAATLSTCVGCHATYRQQIVDEATWQRLTTQPGR